ncbi:putative bifunctional diguanylate cyclase/phosphodiesterase [Paenibacillus sacheonensis]|uniref:EAL domain-containing protein n=1 Tax=Paenibacillus sacheonensis TaxID=742054 RepID=A0A7X4YW45_9BACL|nr:bifunctional diguanylate cyclase/phosphodiesterase [Paenibacillus sacheonensis]MBM7568973.1 diguanylate cyclase (GGDEF)-like protein [Paenibacillus sacheonensis]NBC72654.1 EAL domain-containing protein [Paenibacillus sacheonensis]
MPREEVYDFLTGLPGRRAAFAMLARTVTLARRTGRTVLAALVDIDRFYLVNETKGTAFGDEALRQLAARVRDPKPWSCQAHRFGGNAFLLFGLADGGSGKDKNETWIKELKQSIEEALPVRGQNQYLSCSIGVSRFPEHGETAELLVRHADTALREAKTAGGNRIMVYAEDGTARISRLEKLRCSLRTVLSDHALSLYYQPLYEASGALRGFEALLRWRHPELGEVSPAEFIPLAEESGMIVKIGEWVLEEACGMLRRVQAKGMGQVTMSVNISPLQLRVPEFADVLQRILRQTEAKPECLELEITESKMIDVDSENTIMHQLRGMGVRIALDDFGVGYASLTYLRKLPLHTLKLDRSFIRCIGEKSAEQAIVRSMIALVHQLGLEVVAEGVETEAQLRLLREWDCDYYQGYLLSQPMAEQTVGVPLLYAARDLFQAAREDRAAVL